MIFVHISPLPSPPLPSQRTQSPLVSWFQKEEEKEENRLSEEAERSFGQLQSQEQKDEPAAMREGQEAEPARPDVTYRVENESRPNPNTIIVPVIVTAT